MLTNIFGEKWLDDFFSFPMSRAAAPSRAAIVPHREQALMRTDVRETAQSYELAIELPGFTKEDLQVSLENGYLSISASHDSANTPEEASPEKQENAAEEDAPHYIRRERYYGSVSRTFYIGEDIREDEIAARFENGILNLTIPKLIKAPEQTKKLIAIA